MSAFLPIAAASPAGAATGTLQDVRHVVILAQENRSFDHYYGCLRGVRGFSDLNAVEFPNGNPTYYQPQPGGYVLPYVSTNPCLGAVTHERGTTLAAWHNGKWDQWIPAKGPQTMAYFDRTWLDFYYSLAEAYTICDAYHCSVLGPTGPNRLYLMSGMIDPNGTGGGPVLTNGFPPGGFTWTTYPERLQTAGVSWRVYYQEAGLNPLNWFAQYKNAAPGNPLYDNGVALAPNMLTTFQADVARGTLPQVSWLVPWWGAIEFPPYSPPNGEWLVRQCLEALAANPAIYNSTVFILTYDENGGDFDHVPPPVPPAGVPDEFVAGLPIGLGVRVPMILVSPWTRGGFVCSQVFDHTSIIRFLETWTGVKEPNISDWRRHVCGDLTSAFDFAHPNTNFPALPSVTMVNCTNSFVPVLPAPQIKPAQESGAALARPLPYQPNAASLVDCANRRLWISMTNSGTASVHLAIYANAFRTDGPWQYDVPAGGAITDCFGVTNTALGYDFTCYGPNGFNRRFAGVLGTNCIALDAQPAIDIDGAALAVAFQNPGTASVTFYVTNLLSPGQDSAWNVAGGTTMTQAYPVISNACSYDLRVGSSADPSFVRRFAGRLELGQPILRAQITAGSTELSYPAWASSYTLESTTNIAAGVWVPAAATPVQVTNRMVVNPPAVSGAAFYRLRL